MRGVLLMLSLIIFPGALLGQASYVDPRKDIIDDFMEQRAQNPGLFQSPPINHIVPSLNTITYAGQFEEVNLKLMEEPELSTDKVDKNNVLKVTGYKLEPHLALSLKNIAIGFSIERSKLQEEWLKTDPYYTNEQRQKSSLETSGLGLNLAFMPFKLGKNLKLAFIVGGKSLNVKHSLSYIKGSNGSAVIEDAEMQNFSYTVNHYEAGLNLSWNVLKRFAIVPWVDYAMYDVKAAKSIYSADRYATSELRTVMEQDLNLFFLSYPKLRYGLDFAVQIIGLEVRIGGLLGSLANLNKTVEYIEDDSITISVSIEQKGN